MLLNKNNFSLKSPVIMGVCNITKDSFSDGGKNFRTSDAIKNISLMKKQGATIIDIGAESTRPGSEPITYRQEIKKLEPILKKFQRINLLFQLIQIKLKFKSLL